MRNPRVLVGPLAVCCAAAALAQSSEGQHCLRGCPEFSSPDANRSVHSNSIYSLSVNPRTKLADWVAYRVQQPNLDCTTARTRRWTSDPGLDPDAALRPAAFDHANVTLQVDRGHQAPLASFKCHPAWAATNYTSNLTPQFAKLNQGPWSRLEGAVRDLARTGTDVWVVTGPLFEWPMAKLPSAPADHAIPSSYWKIVAVEDRGTIRASAFYFYQDTPKRADFCDHARTVDFVERKSGLNFFHAFADEEFLESSPPTLGAELGCEQADSPAR